MVGKDYLEPRFACCKAACGYCRLSRSGACFNAIVLIRRVVSSEVQKVRFQECKSLQRNRGVFYSEKFRSKKLVVFNYRNIPVSIKLINREFRIKLTPYSGKLTPVFGI